MLHEENRIELMDIIDSIVMAARLLGHIVKEKKYPTAAQYAIKTPSDRIEIQHFHHFNHLYVFLNDESINSHNQEEKKNVLNKIIDML